MGGTSALIYIVLHPAEITGVPALCPAADLPGYWRWAQEKMHQNPTLMDITHAIARAYGTTPDRSEDLFSHHSALAQRHRLTMQVALAHGTADAIIPIDPTHQLAQILQGQAPVRYIQLAGGNHDAHLPLIPEPAQLDDRVLQMTMTASPCRCHRKFKGTAFIIQCSSR